MRRYSLCVAILLVAALPGLGAETPTDKQLAAMRKIYADTLGDIVAEHDDAIDNWPVNYLKALATLQQQMQKAGRLDGWTAVNTEIERFKAQGDITDADAIAEPDELKTLQGKFHQAKEQMDLAMHKNVLVLSGQYIDRLESMQRDLTQRGNMDEAVRVNTELKAVRSAPEVTAAEFVAAEYEAKTADEETDDTETPEAEADPPATAQPEPTTGQPPRAVGAYEIHDGKPPEIPGVRFRKTPLRPTEHARIGTKASIKLFLGEESFVDKDRSHDPWSSSRSESGTTHHRVRVMVRVSSTRFVLENALLYIEYFCVPAAKGGRTNPKQFTVHCVKLPNVDQSWLTVDCAPVSLYSSSYRYRSMWGSSSHASGEEFYGVIVSVFEEGGDLACQAITTTGLSDQASPKMPQISSDARLAAARGRYEDARNAFYRVRDLHYADPDNDALRTEYEAARRVYEEARRDYDAAREAANL